MAIDTDKIAQEAIDAIAEKIKNLNTLNIIVAGKTGVGKSTLINSVFRDKLAETGMGKPVTDHMRKISKKGIPLSIYDTRGFELGKEVQQQVKQEVVETISKGLATQDINKAIHCIWYCINTASNRVEPEEIEWLKELSKENQTTQVPIIVVLTQSFSKKNADAMRKMLLDENLDVVQIVPVLAEDYEIDDDYVAKSYGLDVLIHVMGEASGSNVSGMGKISLRSVLLWVISSAISWEGISPLKTISSLIRQGAVCRRICPCRSERKLALMWSTALICPFPCFTRYAVPWMWICLKMPAICMLITTR